MTDPVSFGITVGMMGLQMAITASRKIEGPRLDDLAVSTADYGTKRNYFLGKRRFDGVSIIWAEPLIEVKKKKKTKGGKYNDYSYYANFAVDIAAHRIDAVSRIWMDRHLVFDMTGTTPMSPFDFGDYNSAARKRLQNASAIATDHFRIYLGTEDQMPDPRMLATIEALDGPDSCPAYRGSAYALFEDLPVQKFGNRVPIVSIEAISSGSVAFPYDEVDSPISPSIHLFTFQFSSDFSRMIWTDGGDDYAIYDVAARSLMITGRFPSPGVLDGAQAIGLGSDGSIYAISSAHTGVMRFSADGTGGGMLFETPVDQTDVYVVMDGRGTDHLFTSGFSNTSLFYYWTPVGVVQEFDYGDRKPTGAFADLDGNVWLCLAEVGFGADEATLIKWSDVGGDTVNVVNLTGLPDGGPLPDFNAVHYRDQDLDQLVFQWNHNYLGIINLATGAVEQFIYKPLLDVYNTKAQFQNCPPGAASIWLNNEEYSLKDLSVIRSVDVTDWDLSNANGMIYDPINHALIGFPSFEGDIITWRFLDRVAGEGVTLRQVAEKVAYDWSVNLNFFDALDLTQVVKGYSWNNGQGSAVLEPIFDVYDSIIRPHGYDIQCLRLGDASGGTLTKANFLREQGKKLYKPVEIPDTNIPRSISFTFADITKDQQSNAVLEQRGRQNVDSVNAPALNMSTLALDPDEARQLTQRWLRRQWQERRLMELALSPMQLALEPGDVRALDLDNNFEFLWRLRKMVIKANSEIETEWVADDPYIASLTGSAGAVMGGRDDSEILIPALSKGVVLDVPLWRDNDNIASPFVYIGAAPYSSVDFWPGVDFLRSDNGLVEEFDPWAEVMSSQRMDWGYTNEALGDADAGVIDYGNTLNVTIVSGTLDSADEDQILEDRTLNMILVGSEYIQFITADLEGDGTYTLSGLVRGCRGTEQHLATHTRGEDVIIMEPANILGVELSIDEIGDQDYYRPVTHGRPVSSAFQQNLTFTAATAKPYSPAHVILQRQVSGDWEIDWERRSRIGGNMIDGQNVPLGETSEAYKVKIMDGDVVVRTIETTASNATYTAAQQTTDFGSPQTSLSVRVLQVSPMYAIDGFETAMAA